MKKTMVRAVLAMILFAAAAAPARAQYGGFGQNKIVYDKFDWSIYRSTHFQIYYYTMEKDPSRRSLRSRRAPTTSFRAP